MTGGIGIEDVVLEGQAELDSHVLLLSSYLPPLNAHRPVFGPYIRAAAGAD